MTMKRNLLVTGVAAAVCLSGTAAQAGVIIDLFQDPASPLVLESNLNSVTDFAQSGAFPASIIGGWRDASIQQTSDGHTPASDNAFGTTMVVGGGTLTVSNDSLVTSKGVVTWDGSNNAGAGGASVSTTGLGGADLTAGGGATGFIASIQNADLGFAYSIQLWDMDGSSAKLNATVQFGLPFFDPNPPFNLIVDVPYSSHYAFDWFNLGSGNYCDGISVAGPGNCPDVLNDLYFTISDVAVGTTAGIDFTNIGAMQLTLLGGGSADFGLGSITTVPEPASLALMGLGLMGIAGLRRRKVY